MYRILISGYYGFNNIGDESILSAVISNLREKLTDIQITVLSQDPESTSQKYDVKSVNRKSLTSILRAVKNTDLLISGGGSLLQDVTSKKSIIYYLAIMWMALILRKKVLIYSQGIGPINSNINRRLTAWTLNKVGGIVVRDEASREYLGEIGVNTERVQVTADPVLRIKPADRSVGAKILSDEGIPMESGKLRVGFAIRERKLDSDFMQELTEAIEKLQERYEAQVILIPFHYMEDMKVIEELERRLSGRVYCLKHKYLSSEMLSIIGNMDLLVGVRLHALIHAAIMEVPMIGISYDPKINSFMKSIGGKAMCSIYDFSCEDFLEEFKKTLDNREVIRSQRAERLSELKKALEKNEEIIRGMMKR